jgi:hypothetical protein
MDFVIVLLLLLAVRYWWGELPVFGAGLAGRWLAWIALHLEGIPVYVVGVLLPSLGLGWLSATGSHIGFGLPVLILHVVVLLWVIRAPSPEFIFDALHVQTRQSEDTAVGLKARQDHQLRELLVMLHEDFFVYVLWYLLLGPAGPLFCYLQRQFEQLNIPASDASVPVPDLGRDNNSRTHISPWLIGLAVRVSLLLLALVGQFKEGWRLFLDSLKTWTLDESDLLHSGFEAVLRTDEEDDFAASSRHWLDRYEQLLSRLFFGWMGFAAVLILLS